MSLFSYQQGLSQGNARSIAAVEKRNEAVQTANDWKRVASELKDEFAQAESSRLGFAQLARALTEELRRADPANPLLTKDNQLRILNESIADQATRLGYSYDPASGTVVRKG